MRILTGISVLLLIGCGIETKNNVALTDAERSFARAQSHLADRCFTSECVSDKLAAGEEDSREYLDEAGQKIGTADDIIGQEANAAREYATDREITSERIAYKIGTGDNEAGAEANRARKDLYGRGIEEIRHGDQDTKQKIIINAGGIAENKSAIEANAAATEQEIEAVKARLDSIEAINSLQFNLLDVLEAKFQSELNSVEAILSGNLADLEVAVEDLSGVVDSNKAEASSALAAHKEVFDNVIKELKDSDSELQLNIDANAAAIAANGLSIDSNSDSISVNSSEIASNAQDILNILEDLQVIETSLELHEQALDELSEELEDQGVSISALESEVEELEDDVSSLERITSRHGYLIARLFSKARSAQYQISSLQRDYRSLSSSLGSLRSSFYQFKNYQYGVNSRFHAELRSLSRKLNRAKQELHRRIDGVQTNVNQNSSILAFGATIVLGMLQDIQELEEAVESNEVSIDSLESSFNSLDDRVEILEAMEDEHCELGAHRNDGWPFHKKYRQLTCGNTSVWVRIR